MTIFHTREFLARELNSQSCFTLSPKPVAILEFWKRIISGQTKCYHHRQQINTDNFTVNSMIFAVHIIRENWKMYICARRPDNKLFKIGKYWNQSKNDCRISSIFWLICLCSQKKVIRKKAAIEIVQKLRVYYTVIFVDQFKFRQFSKITNELEDFFRQKIYFNQLFYRIHLLNNTPKYGNSLKHAKR